MAISDEEFDTMKEILASAASYAESAHRNIDALRAEVSAAVAAQRNTQLQLNALASQFTAFVAQVTADRAAETQSRDEFRQQMIGLQTESRNILKFLMERQSQPGNGSGD